MEYEWNLLPRRDLKRYTNKGKMHDALSPVIYGRDDWI